jgi:hypothetical protein
VVQLDTLQSEARTGQALVRKSTPRIRRTAALGVAECGR